MCKLNIDSDLLKLAEIDFNYIKQKGQQIAEVAPHVYDWSKKNLYDGRTNNEVLQEALSER